MEGIGDTGSDRELEPEELEEILSKMKDSMQSDIRQAVVWNTLGSILLKTGRLQVQLHCYYSCLNNHFCHFHSLCGVALSLSIERYISFVIFVDNCS